jgi:hypothetical protein
MKLVDVTQIEPSTYNPRIADPARLDLIELSLRKLGFLLPLYATPDGEIISGHQRHHVACRMGAKQVPLEVTRSMDLAERKGVNVVFNRATNDLGQSDTVAKINEQLKAADVQKLAKGLPDKAVDSPEFYPCLTAKMHPIAPFLKANQGRWKAYSLNIAKTLKRRGITMPVVATRDYRVVNGIGRLQHYAEQSKEEIPVVFVTDEEGKLAEAMLNYLSMDFDIHRRYEDLLRHNSFRRLRQVRNSLGRGFIFAVAGDSTAKAFDMDNQANRDRWIKQHGRCVLDFGAGHLHETRILRKLGISITPFEPYRVNDGDEIDKAESIALTREFLHAIGTDKLRWSSIFISSVLNSVPFHADRQHIACICAALADDATRLYAVASASNHINLKQLSGYHSLNERQSGAVLFKLDYEPGITLGDIATSPKVQKYHSQKEFYGLFKEFFAKVQVNESNSNVQAVCSKPLAINPKRLKAAIAFEFDLPYPDGSRMGLVEEAISAFEQRLGMKL